MLISMMVSNQNSSVKVFELVKPKENNLTNKTYLLVTISDLLKGVSKVVLSKLNAAIPKGTADGYVLLSIFLITSHLIVRV